MRIIPAIDLMNGKCVRLRQGNFEKSTEYSADPLQLALELEKAGARFLHVVDLDAARSKKLKNVAWVEKIATHTHMEVDYGGGITQLLQVQTLLKKGVRAINIGSLAFSDPAEFKKIIREVGTNKIILSVDIRDNLVAVDGWQTHSITDIFGFIESLLKTGISRLCCTDISRDGMLNGPALHTYRTLKEKFPQLEIIASGGVSKLEDISALKEAGADGAIVGKALYEGKLKIQDLLC